MDQSQREHQMRAQASAVSPPERDEMPAFRPLLLSVQDQQWLDFAEWAERVICTMFALGPDDLKP